MEECKENNNGAFHFFDFEDCNMELFEAEADDGNSVSAFSCKGSNKYIVDCVKSMGVCTALQIYAFVINKPYYKKITLKSVKNILRILVKEGILCYIALEGGENSQRLYILGKKGMALYKKEMVYERNLAIYGGVKESEKFPEILKEQVVINQFVAASMNTCNVVKCEFMVDLSKYELKVSLCHWKTLYLPAQVTVSEQISSTVANTSRSKFLYRKKLVVFPLSVRHLSSFNTEAYLVREFCAIAEYSRVQGIDKYLIVVVVPEHKTAQNIHAELLKIGDKNALSHFYLLENDMFYAPYKNLFTIAGDNEAIRQYCLF